MGKRPFRKKRQEKAGFKPIKGVDHATLRQQKLYHYEKQLHKAIKKAKKFEIRKVSRRLKQASESQTKDGGEGGKQTAAVQKLLQQLEAVRAVDPDILNKQAAVELDGGNNDDIRDNQPEPQELQVVALVRARILSAKCVQVTQEAAREALARLDAAAQQLPAAAAKQLPAAGAQPATEPEQAEPDLAAGPGQSHLQSDAASSGDEALEGTSPEGPSASSDELEEDEEQTAPKRRKLPGSSGNGAQKAAAERQQPKPPPKKKKNRLGQRARKLLAGAPQGGVPSTQVGRSGASPQHGQPAGQLCRLPAVTAAPHRRPAVARTGQGASIGQRPAAASAPHQAKGPLKALDKGHEQLHPSWAAKKAMADKGGLLAPSQGTKVVFGDDD